jgi:hypothetical protein
VLLTIPLLLHDVTADVDMFHVSGAMVMWLGNNNTIHPELSHFWTLFIIQNSK